MHHPQTVLALALGLVPLLAPGAAWGLPDLTAEVASISFGVGQTVDAGDVAEGCAGGPTGRTLVKFGLRTRNEGSTDLVMGDPLCPDCPSNPGVICGNPLYRCSEAHGHPHFEEYVLAELVDGGGNVVATGRKQGFCLLDSECPTPVYNCGNQGISAGCADVYVEGLPCQYIDITDEDVPPGTYTLRVTVDPDGLIPEEDETNNIDTEMIVVTGPAPACPIYESTDIPKAIPDEGTVVSDLMVSATGTADAVRVVGLSGTHTWMSDLRFRLTAPSGESVLAVDRVCSDADGFELDLADGLGPAIPCPPNVPGVYAPSQPLAGLSGANLAGVWALEVSDLAGGDTGTLSGWGLEICPRCGNGTLDPGEACDDGNTADGDCCSADCQAAAPDGTTCTRPSHCVEAGTCSSGICDGPTSCDSCLSCNPPNGCTPPVGVLCDSMHPRKARVSLRAHPTDPDRRRLSFDWTSDQPVSVVDFGNPVSGTQYSLCVFDDSGLRFSSRPDEGICGNRLCWQAGAGRYVFRDADREPEGLRRIALKEGDAGRARVKVRGKGSALPLDELSFQGPVTVRLKRNDGPGCWQAEFEDPSRSDAFQYRARWTPHDHH